MVYCATVFEGNVFRLTLLGKKIWNWLLDIFFPQYEYDGSNEQNQ